MLGMVIVHYVWPDGSGSVGDTVAEVMSGRAMPLFMLLGGIGVTLVSSRSLTPDRDLLIRAGLLLALGLVLQETTEWIAVVLQSYGLFFALAPLFRRLSDRALLVGAVIVAVAGSWTFQTVGAPRRTTTYSELLDQRDGLVSLVFDGYYPFFPVAAFFLLGLWLGRLDLRSDRVAALLVGVGVALGIGTVWLADGLAGLFDVDPAAVEAGSFRLARLLDHDGHSAMLAWVLSATGTSIAVLGLSLLAGRRAAGWLSPLTALGMLALTFYVFQAVLTNVVAEPSTTSFGQEYVTVAIIYGGFMVAAMIWKQWFRFGPFEALLRVGSGPRRPDGPARATALGRTTQPDTGPASGRAGHWPGRTTQPATGPASGRPGHWPGQR